jgi:heterodisulfide reductase subunit A2
MMDAGRHPNIELLSYSEVEEVSGFVGNFKVKVRKKARYVDEDKCTGCGLCWSECMTKRIPQLKLIKKGDISLGERRPGER